MVNEWRSEKASKTVLQRAKAILAAGPEFFAPDSLNERVEGPELYERVMRMLLERLVERTEGGCLTVTQAYTAFCHLAQQRGLGTLKRSIFKENMSDLVRDAYGVCLRHDVPDLKNKHQQAWKGLRIVETLAA